MKKNKFQLVSMNEGLAQIEGRPEVANKRMPSNIEDLPIHEFLCHLTDRTRARAFVNEMAKTMFDPEIKKTIQETPLKTSTTAKKNMLVAMSDAAKVFTIDLKTGRMFHE